MKVHIWDAYLPYVWQIFGFVRIYLAYVWHQLLDTLGPGVGIPGFLLDVSAGSCHT